MYCVNCGSPQVLRFCYGWCPLVLTPELLAGVDGHEERVPVDDFERAVGVMADVARAACT